MESLSLPAKLESLSSLRQYVLDAARAAGLDEKKTYNLQLAIDEIATNIITYGYKDPHLDAEITIMTELSEEELTIILEDSGVEFDPRSWKLPEEKDLTRSLEERSIGGLGIFLAIKGVDRFDYERRGNRNRNIFKMNLKGGRQQT